MSNEIALLISYITKNENLLKVCLKLNKFKDYMYFKEDHILKYYKSVLPEHISNNIQYIVEVEEITDCIIKDK